MFVRQIYLKTLKTTKNQCVCNIMQALQEVKVPGRSELVENKLELTVMIDYAHTADSLKNI